MAEGEVLQELVTKLGYEVDTGGLENLKHSLEQIAERTKLLLAVEVFKGLYELAERFSSIGEELESSAIAAGLTTVELQKLQFAASQNAVGASSLNMALSRLGRLLYQAQNGSKGAASAFEKLGISKDQIAGFSSTEDALFAIQDGIGKLGSQQEKLAVVQQLFGRSGARFLKFLEVGSDGTRKLKDRAQEMGAVISDRGVKALAEFEDAASGLGQVFKSFLATVASSFAPGFVGAIESIEDAWGRNRQIISDGLDALAEKFSYVMGYIEVSVANASRIINAILYRNGGIGDFIKSTATQIYSVVTAIGRFIATVFKSAMDDGSLQKFGEDFFRLIKDIGGVVGDLISNAGLLLDKIAELFGVKTDGLNNVLTVLRAIGATVDALVVSLDALVKVVRFFTGGQIGDFLGQTKLGEYYDKAQRVFTMGTPTGGVPGYGSAAPQRMSVANALQTMAVMEGMSKQAPQSPIGSVGTPVGSAPVVINSTTNVTAPPGMTPTQVGDLFAQKHRDSLVDALNEADRDTTPAWKY